MSASVHPAMPFPVLTVSALPLSLIASLPVPRKTAVLITGCSSGIGEAAALRLLKANFLVFATVRKQQDADALKLKAGKSNMLHTLLLDVTKEEQIRAAVAAVKQRLAQEDRKLLGLVNNAGGAEQSPLELLPLDTLRAQLELNLYGPLAVTRAFLPLLRSASSPTHSSRLLFLSSISGRFAIPGLSSYSASKFALEAAVDALRLELRHFHIDVTAVEPGQTATRFNDRVERSGVGGRDGGEWSGGKGVVRGCEGEVFSSADVGGSGGVDGGCHRVGPESEASAAAHLCGLDQLAHAAVPAHAHGGRGPHHGLRVPVMLAVDAIIPTCLQGVGGHRARGCGCLSASCALWMQSTKELEWPPADPTHVHPKLP